MKAPGGLEADFGEIIDQAEGALPAGTPPQPEAAKSALEQISSGKPPALVVDEAWRRLDDRLRSISAEKEFSDGRGRLKDAILIARRLGLSEEFRQLIYRLRDSRNAAVHSDSAITDFEAAKYNELIAEAMRLIDEVA